MNIGELIVKTPGVCGGRARLAGRRIPISSIYRWFRAGSAPEEILTKYEEVTLTEIYAAITYALANLAEIGRELELEERLAKEAEGASRIDRSAA